jgi:hypothetical protein
LALRGPGEHDIKSATRVPARSERSLTLSDQAPPSAGRVSAASGRICANRHALKHVDDGNGWLFRA